MRGLKRTLCILSFAFSLEFGALTLGLGTSFSQTPPDISYQWAKNIGSGSDDRGNSIAVDASGNTYITGFFIGGADFDPGAGTVNLTVVGQSDIFFAKYNSSGVYQWAKNIGSAGDDYGNSIAVDASGNCYITGVFSGTADFDPDAGTANLTPPSSPDIFFAKYNTSGVYQWAKSIGGLSGSNISKSIAVDASDNVYITGYFSGTADFDPGPGTANLTPSASPDIFFAKYNTTGNYLWAKNIAATSNSYSKSIAIDASGYVYITGNFWGTADFDPGAGTANLTAVGTSDIFFAKYDASGNYFWAKNIGSITDDDGWSIAVDASGNCYITGYFQGTADFDPGAGTANLTSLGNADIFFAKYNSSGAYQWAKNIGSTGYDYGRSIAVDASGNCYITGHFQGTADFDPGTGTLNLTSFGSDEIFFAKYNSLGIYHWAKNIGSTSPDYGQSIAVDALGNVYITGLFQDTADFDPCVGTANLTSVGNYDIFFAKYGNIVNNGISVTSINNPTTYLANDGAITISVFFSAPPYVYQWNNSNGAFSTTEDISGLSQDYYSLIVTDSVGCKTGETFILTQPVPATPVYFQNVYGAGYDAGNSVAQTSDGGFIVAGSRSNTVYILKTDKAGYVQWSHTYNPYDGVTQLSCGTGIAYSVKQTLEGGYIVTGACTTDVMLLKLNSNGEIEWNYTYYAAGVSDAGYSVVQTADSGYATAGIENNYLSVLKTNKNGQLLWNKSFYYGNSVARAIIQTNDFGLVIVGTDNTPSYSYNLIITKLDFSGTFIFERTIGGNQSTVDEGYSVIQTTDGSLLIAGYTESFGNFNDLLIVKVGTNGSVQWAKSYGGISFEAGYSVKQCPDSGYIICGEAISSAGGWGSPDLLLLRTDELGNLQWAKTYGGRYSEKGNEIQVCSDGGYVMVGTTYSYGSGLSNIFLLRTDEYGNAPGCEPLDITSQIDVSVAAINTYIPSLTTASLTGENDAFLLYSYAGAPWSAPDISTTVSITGETTCQSGDGTAAVSAAGGTPPYNYYWSTGSSSSQISNLQSATYNVTVTDNDGCAERDMVAISGFTPPGISITTLGESACQQQDGIAIAAATGGAPPYTYGWSNGANQPAISNLQPGIYYVTVSDSNNCFVIDTAIITGFTPPTLTLTPVNPTGCGSANGAVILSISGGQSPFAYQWSNGATTQNLTGKAAGSYAVTVTDANGCLVTGSSTLNDPSSLAINVTSTDVTVCGGSDGTAAVAATGGSAPYTYLWSNLTGFQNLSGLSAGTYAVTVSDNAGCARTGYAVINAPQSLTLTSATTQANCNAADGSATLTASGGTNPYNYYWSNGATSATPSGLVAGIYVVTVTDSLGCSGSTAVAVSNSSGLTVVPSVTNVLCNGGSNGSISLSVSGGATPYTYSWSTGSTAAAITNLQAGPYEIIVTDNDTCLVTQTINVSQPAPITVSIATSNATCGATDGSASATPSGGSSPYSYSWSSGGTANVEGGLGAGIYAVQVSDSNGCIALASAVIGETGAPVISNAAVTPNTCGSSGGTIDISVSGGVPPYTYNWSNGVITQDISNLAAGIYSLTVTGNNGCKSFASYTITGQQPQQQPVCLVTTDDNAKNIVVWERVQQSGISHYNIYRETTQSGVYQLASTIPFSQLSEYTDVNSNAQVRSYRYKISAVDTCGSESLHSPPHQTIHLTTNLGMGNTVNLLWNHYDGFSFGTYYIWRFKQSTGWVKVDSIPSTLNSYTDTTPGTGSIKYAVEAAPPYGCISTLKTKNYNTSLSNTTTIVKTGTLLSATVTTTPDGGSCTGTATVTPGGGQSPYTYQWSITPPPLGGQGGVTGLCAGNYTVTVTDVSGDYTVLNFTIGVCPAPVVDFAASQTSGNAPLMVDFFDMSANSPDSLLWTFFGATPLNSTLQNPTGITYNIAGTYSVKLEAFNSCGSNVLIKNGFITVNSAGGSTLIATTTATADSNNLCNGTATVLVNGGITPYTYLWSNGGVSASLNALCSGIYTVTVTDAAGSSYIAMAQVTAVNTCLPPLADFAASQTSGNAPLAVNFFDVSANNPDSVKWTFFGATPPTSSLQNPTGVTYNIAGTYSVKLEAYNSCGSDVEIKSGYITVNSSGGSTLTAIATATADTNNQCNGTAAAAAAGGSPPYTYLWSNGGISASLSALCSGIYTVTVTDAAGSSYIAMAQVQAVNTCLPPLADFAASQTSGNAPLPVDFFDLTANNSDSVKWTFFGATPLNSALQNPMGITYTTAGTYSVKLQAYNNCGNDVEIKSGYITILPGVGIEENDFIIGLNLFPNPTTNFVTISYFLPKSGKITIEITDVIGKKIATIADSEKQIQGEHTYKYKFNEPGVYIIFLKTEEGIVVRKQISL